MKNEVISIIVPVFNAEDYIERCIESIVNQTYKALDIILIDDGSTDKSGIICDNWANKDKRIKVIHQENSGVSSARNKGLKYVKGKYVAFVDADDYLEINMYEKMLNQFDDCTDIVVCNHYRTSNSSKTVASIEYPTSNWKDELIIFRRVTGYLWDKLYRFELVQGEKFKTNICFMEDLIFNYSIGNKKVNYRYLDEPLYNYYQHNSSATHSKYLYNESALDATIEMIKLLEKDYSECIINWIIFYEKKYYLYKYSFNKMKLPSKKINLYREYAKTFEKKYDIMKHMKIREKLEFIFISKLSLFYYLLKKIRTKLTKNKF